MAFLKSLYPPTWIDLKEKAGEGTKAYLEPKEVAQITNFPSPISSHKVRCSQGLRLFLQNACDTGVFS